MKFTFAFAALCITQCAAATMDYRTTTIQLVEEVFNRKDVNALDKFYDQNAIMRDNIYNGRREEIRGLDRIKEVHFDRCPVYNHLSAVFTIEDSVVSEEQKTIRYVMAMHSAVLGKYTHDVIRISVLHRFNEAGKIVLTHSFGDLTSIEAHANRSQLPESEINRMKALIPIKAKNYRALNDLIFDDAKVYFPEATQQGKGPISRDEAVKLMQEYDKCFSEQTIDIMWVLHEQSRPNEVAVVWKWRGTFDKQCPAPYGQFKPTGKQIHVCGITQFEFCRTTGRITEMRSIYDTQDVRNQMAGGVPKMLEMMMPAHAETSHHIETA